MTKLELMKMLENVNDNEKITFVVDGHDRDGYPEDHIVNVYKVLGGEVVRVRGEYDIHRYENLTNDLEYVEKKNMYGIDIGYWRKRG